MRLMSVASMKANMFASNQNGLFTFLIQMPISQERPVEIKKKNKNKKTKSATGKRIPLVLEDTDEPNEKHEHEYQDYIERMTLN